MSGNGLGVAIIGCGGITSAHLNGLRILQEYGLGDVRVAVLCSRDERNAARYNDRSNAPEPLPEIVPGTRDPLNIRDIYVTDLAPGTPARIRDDWRAAVSDTDVDVVIILASVDVHHMIALGALAEGKHVLIEKPFAITVRAARKVCEVADAMDLRVAVAENLRYNKSVRAKRWAIDSGYIGQVQMVVHIGIGSVWAPDKIVGKTAWRHQKYLAGGGILMDVGAHLFDSVRYLAGEPLQIAGMVRTVEPLRTTRNDQGEVVEQVTCDVEDTAFASISFASGATGTFNMSWAGHGRESHLPGGMVIYGDMGCITGDNIVSEHVGTVSLSDTFALRADPELLERWFPLGIEDTFALELNEFFTAVRQGRKPETDGVEGLRDIAVGYGIVESSVRGRAVDFKDVESCLVESYQRPINDLFGIRS